GSRPRSRDSPLPAPARGPRHRTGSLRSAGLAPRRRYGAGAGHGAQRGNPLLRTGLRRTANRGRGGGDRGRVPRAHQDAPGAVRGGSRWAAVTAFAGLRCIRCGREFDDGPASLAGCPACATEKSRSNGTCVYDYDALKGRFPHEAVAAGQRGLWRWDALLPVSRRAAVTLGEGDTPLLRCDGLARAWGLKELSAKDETRNPTWSYKDRLCSVAISVARQKGARVIVVSSTGNHGAAAAAYAARAGLRCVVLTTVSVPTTMKTLMQSYGAAVVALPTLEDRW